MRIRNESDRVEGSKKRMYRGDGFGNTCPKCGGKQFCPCPACRKRHKQEVVWKWVTGNGPIACGHCGHTMEVGEWEDREWEQYKEWSKPRPTPEKPDKLGGH